MDDYLKLKLREEDRLRLTIATGASIGTDDYNELKNKPSINTVTLIGDRSLESLGAQKQGNYIEEDDALTNMEIDAIIGAFTDFEGA